MASSPTLGQPVSSTTTAPRLDPTVTVTSFVETTQCDPEARDADLQVVQAFVTAYNQRDAVRIEELVDSDEIWDLGGFPHLGQVRWEDVGAWAEKGWAVNDKLELTHVVRYGPDAGSDITVRRTNDVLEADGIHQLVLLIKVPSSGCTTKRLIAGVSTEADGCAFYHAYVDRVRALDGVTQLEVPERGTG